MMIKVDAVRMCDGSPLKIEHSISLNDLCNKIATIGQESGVDLLVTMDEVKAGGGIFTKAQPCVVIYNSKHQRDYYFSVLVQNMQGKYAYITQYMAGKSKNFEKEVLSKSSGLLMGKLLGPNHQKQNEEHIFYDAVNEIIAEAICNIL